MTGTSLKQQIKAKAQELGFDITGICSPEYSPVDHNRLLRWLERDYHGDMDYMSRNTRMRSDPRLFFEDVRSIISVGANYFKEPGYDSNKPYISIYARGKPYQQVLKDRLKELLDFIKHNCPGVNGKIAVDTSPTFDKLWAEKAGIGWRGKNTLILNKDIGSFIFLGEIFVNIELEPDKPAADHCADCIKCIDACPTDALEKPYLLNASRCISYLTIEAKGDLENPELVGNHILGCDLCQLVCPFNKSAPMSQIPEFLPENSFVVDINDNWDNFDEIEFKSRYKGTILQEFGFIKYKKNVETVKINMEK